MKFLITGVGGLAVGLGAGAVWNQVDKPLASQKNKNGKKAYDSNSSTTYSPLIRSDPQLHSAMSQLESIQTIRPAHRKTLIEAMDALGKHWITIERSKADIVSSDASYKAAELYENVHKALDYMFEHSGVPMHDGFPSSYEMKKIYTQILRSSNNWKHNATIAAQSKRKYL